VTSGPLYPGIETVLGGQTYVIPPLSLGQVRRFQSQLQDWAGKLEDQSIDLAIAVIHAAISRNYPELTLEAVADLVDIGNMAELMQAVMDVSGLLRRAADEKKAAATRDSTGTDSTVT
jgi:hypothetical protein